MLYDFVGARLMGLGYSGIVYLPVKSRFFLGLLSHRVISSGPVVLHLLIHIRVLKFLLHTLLDLLFKVVSAGNVFKHDVLFVGLYE